MNINQQVIIVTLIFMLGLYVIECIFKRWILPKLDDISMKEIDRNPKWVTKQLISYYGFDDIDFVLFDSIRPLAPRLKTNKTKDRLELWLPCDTLTGDIPEYARLALAGKLHARYNIWHPDKPIHWLSVLLFMLDGGEIKMEDCPKSTNKRN